MTEPLAGTLDLERRAYVDALEATLHGILDNLARRPTVRQIVLFGSYAAGRRDLGTDLDLLIVMDSPEDFVTRTANLHRELRSKVDLDLLVYTPAEFERMRDKPFIRGALENGKVLLAR